MLAVVTREIAAELAFHSLLLLSAITLSLLVRFPIGFSLGPCIAQSNYRGMLLGCQYLPAKVKPECAVFRLIDDGRS